MIELPITIRHNFSSRSRTKGFAAIGLSSYLMKKEQYDYLYYYGNTGTYAVHYKSYNNSSKNWLSVLQVSGGFNRKLSRYTSLRVEPYIKMPLQGVGFGKLSLLSGGVNFGITKDLF